MHHQADGTQLVLFGKQKATLEFAFHSKKQNFLNCIFYYAELQDFVCKEKLKKEDYKKLT
jgi:hypothetical protein